MWMWEKQGEKGSRGRGRASRKAGESREPFGVCAVFLLSGLTGRFECSLAPPVPFAPSAALSLLPLPTLRNCGLMNLKYLPSVGTLRGMSLLQKALHLIQSAFLSVRLSSTHSFQKRSCKQPTQYPAPSHQQQAA